MNKKILPTGKKQPREIGAGEFKAKCLALMDTVSKRKEEIIITKRGEPIAKLVPFEQKLPDFYGFLRGSVKIKGDIVKSPFVQWNADA